MSQELQKRIITSVFLISLLSLMYFYSYVLIISLIVIAMIAWIEFYGLISKIFIKTNINHKIKRFTFKAISLFYLLLLIFFILLIEVNYSQLKIFIIYSILVSILSDIGGLIVGKIFKGKKLTKISPKKTISGAIGSFIFSLFLLPFFSQNLIQDSLSFFLITPINHNFWKLFMITLIISLVSQIGDLIFSYLKRKAKVKDTSDLLPGHGGILDRIDGIIFAIPVGFYLLNF
jgi:phosphatidate cytidylyltransferase